MTKTVRRLSGLEIDEVSLVDRPANQHGLVAITKRDEGPMLFDADGNPVDEADLQPGDFVYDENGQEFQALSEEDVAQLEQLANEGEGEDKGESAPSELRELAEVGKSRGPGNTPFKRGRKDSGRAAVAGGKSTVTYVGSGRKVGKSLGAEILEELSKAASDSDRDQVIAKALGQIDQADARADQAWSIAKALQDQQELGKYVELAKGYALPVDPTDLGEILQAVSKSLSPEQLDTVDRIFNFAGDAFAAQSAEIGSAGYQPSPLMGQVSDYAHEVVGKSDLTPEQAVVALFETNPEAYDAYLSEQSER